MLLHHFLLVPFMPSYLFLNPAGQVGLIAVTFLIVLPFKHVMVIFLAVTGLRVGVTTTTGVGVGSGVATTVGVGVGVGTGAGASCDNFT